MNNFATLLKIVGWIFTSVPLILFLLFSIVMVKKISEDDESVKLIVSLCMTAFFLGVVLLLLTYLTNTFAG